MRRFFFGGIHPKYNKEMSTEIVNIQKVLPKIAVLPMQQHIGAPCKPLVNVGDSVLRGQKIGDGEGLCVPVHASVSGKVIAVEPRPHTNGSMVMSVVIENDFKDASIVPEGMTGAEENLDADVVLHKIREAGITAPVVPGIMPITAGNQVARAIQLSGSFMPRRFVSLVDKFGSNPAAMKQAGIAYATDQIIDLYANGVKNVHVYTMNKPDVARKILENLSEILG